MPGFLAGVGSWLGKNALGLLGAGGALVQNRSADRQAQRQMDFQERMSSTAAQRAVKDYAAAGLNPALAYDRPASSPGGSIAPVENAVASGLSAKQAAANIELTKAQTEKVNAEKAMVDTDISLRTVSGEGEPSWRDEQLAARLARLRDMQHAGTLQPHERRLKALEVMLARAGLTGAQFKAESLTDLDAVRDFIKNGLSSAGSAADAVTAWRRAGESRIQGMAGRSRAAVDAAAREISKRRKNTGGW